MDFNVIMQAIGSLGFPIAMCIALLWYMNKQTETHKAETSKMIEAINNNTLALSELKNEIGVGKNG